MASNPPSVVHGVVVRSVVTAGRPVGEYRELLRFDFWYACAYCSTAESEAWGIGFEIDHHRPQRLQEPDCDEYPNLMWACEHCNGAKSGNWPSDEEIAAGFRFLRPDMDDPREHIASSGREVSHRSRPGQYTIEVLNLNRESLCKIRELRERLGVSRDEIANGLRRLLGFRIDRLAPEYRQRFSIATDAAKNQMEALGAVTEQALVVRVLNHSPILDPDPRRKENTRRRRDFLASIRAPVTRRGEASN